MGTGALVGTELTGYMTIVYDPATLVGSIGQWSFTSGALTLSNVNGDSLSYRFFDPSSQNPFSSWDFDAIGMPEGFPGFGLLELETIYLPGMGGLNVATVPFGGTIAEFLSENSAPGTWVATPEPAYFLVLAVGLAGIALARAAKKQSWGNES